MALIRAAGHDAPIYLHGALEPLTALYKSEGIDLGDTPKATAAKKSELAGRIVLAPPSATQDLWSRRLPDPVTAFASGWMRVRARARQKGVELPLVISDHADWDDLCGTIAETGAGEVWVTHGQEDALVHWCRTRGLRRGRCTCSATATRRRAARPRRRACLPGRTKPQSRRAPQETAHELHSMDDRGGPRAWRGGRRLGRRARPQGRRLQAAGPDRLGRERAGRQSHRRPAGRSDEIRALCHAAHLAAGQHEPPAFPSQRPLLHRRVGEVVGRLGTEFRPRGDGADPGRQSRDPLRQGRAFRRRQGRAGDDPRLGRRPGDVDAVRTDAMAVGADSSHRPRQAARGAHEPLRLAPRSPRLRAAAQCQAAADGRLLPPHAGPGARLGARGDDRRALLPLCQARPDPRPRRGAHGRDAVLPLVGLRRRPLRDGGADVACPLSPSGRGSG